MIASQVAQYISKTPEVIFESFPGMYRRMATASERGALAATNITKAAHVTLVSWNMKAECIGCLILVQRTVFI